MANESEVAKNFWLKQIEYPSSWDIPRRRLKKINWIIDNISDDVLSICDVCTGDGTVPYLMSQIIPIQKIYLIDQNISMLNTAFNRFKGSEIYAEIRVCNLNVLKTKFPETDITLFLGAIHYIFDDDIIKSLFSNYFNSKQIIITAPCSVKDENELINKFSNELKSEYAALYRTVGNITNLIDIGGFNITKIERLYPDSIESKFGTKQFAFNCFKK